MQNLLSETRDDTEISNKSNNNPTIPPLISEEEMDMMDSVDGSDTEHMSTEMLEDIPGVSQYHPGVNKRDALYKIFDSILNEAKHNGKERYYLRKTWVKVYKKSLRLL